MMYEAEEEENKIDVLYETPTTERNGVKIVVPVKYRDSTEFIDKMRQQLAYFENVYFDCHSIPNDFTIHRHEDFQWSSLSEDTCMHLCLDNVYYPIDFEKLGIGRLSFPVGLRFSLTDGIFPLPNRETLKYTKEAKEIILAKIKKVAVYFVNKYNESVKKYEDNIFEILALYNNSLRQVDIFKGTRLNVSTISSFSNVKFILPKLKDVKYLSTERINIIKDYLLKEYRIKYYCSYRKLTPQKDWKSSLTCRIIETASIYEYSEDISGIKKTYLKEVLPNGSYIVTKIKKIGLGDIKGKYRSVVYDNYISILGLHSFPKEEWRERIKECQYVMSLLTAGFKSIDKMEIPQQWHDDRKNARKAKLALKPKVDKRKKLSGEIMGKMSVSLERYTHGKHCKFVPTIFDMKTAHTSKYFLIYGSAENEEEFQKWFSLTKTNNVKFVMFSDRELKKLKDVKLHNWMSMEEFKKGEHKVFRRAATAYLISKLKSEYAHVFAKQAQLENISSTLAEKIKNLSDYTTKYFLDGDEELHKAISKLAEEKKLVDMPIYSTYKEVKFILEKLKFANVMFSRVYGVNKNDEMLEPIKDLFKYYKQRINWQNYKLQINEDVKVEEKNTELLIEDEF